MMLSLSEKYSPTHVSHSATFMNVYRETKNNLLCFVFVKSDQINPDLLKKKKKWKSIWNTHNLVLFQSIVKNLITEDEYKSQVIKVHAKISIEVSKLKKSHLKEMSSNTSK